MPGFLKSLVPDRERRGFGEELAKIPSPAEAAASYAGPVVTEDRALHHIDVFKCVSLIADAVSMMPARAYRQEAYVGEDGEIRLFARKLRRQPALLTDPMPGDMTPEFSFKHRVMSSILLNGNTYNEVNALDRQGFPSVVTPIHPDKVRQPRINNAGLVEWVMHDGGVMGSYRDGGTMVHWPGFIQAGSMQGMSPIKAGMHGIGLGVAAERFGSRWFGDGANPSGVLINPNQVNEQEAKEAKAAWVRQYSNLNREPAYLYGGLDWKPISIAPEESQFIETRKMQSTQIAGLYRVPPHLVSDVEKSTSWGTGIEEQGIGFVTYTLQPWLTRFEQALSFLLPRGQFVKFTVGALLRGKVRDRNLSYAVGRQWGYLSVNDIRALEDLPPIEGGDVYLQPLNMVDVESAQSALALLEDQDIGTLEEIEDIGDEEDED